MKGLLFILFFFYISVCEGKSIYISNSGSDVNTGLSPVQAWKSLKRLNLGFTSGFIVNGDVINLDRGSVFHGYIDLNKSVTFLPYGSGNKPVISGFYTLDGWTNVSGNIFECTPDSATKRFCNILTIADVPQTVGRFPNGTSFLTFQSATTTQLVSSSLTGTPNYASLGAEVVIRKIAYIAERAVVTAQSGTTLTYGTTPSIDPSGASGNRNATEGTGFFFQRFAASLDAQNEWYFNPTTNRMQIYSTVNPNTLDIKASYVDTLVKIGSTSNVSFNNIVFEGANLSVFLAKDGDGITITNCDFINNTRVVNFHNVGTVNITGCTFDNTFNACIYNYSTHKSFYNINNNTFTNTGQIFGMGIFATEANLRVIYNLGDIAYQANAYTNIIGNRITKVGSSGIYYNGSNVIVRRNVIDTFNNLLDDGGAIYSYIGSANDPSDYRNRIVDSNFISNSVGAPNGATGSQSSCIYNDGFTKNVTIKNNTLYNITGTLKGNGVQTSNPINVILRNNTIYNTDVCVNINMINYADAPPFAGISGTFIDSNILYQKTNASTKFITRHINTNLFNPPLTIYQSFHSWYQDNNWISNQQATSFTFYYWLHYPNGYSGFKFYNLTQWRDTTLHDVNSILPPVTLTNTNTNLYVNPSDTPHTVNFIGLRKIDPKGNVYNNSVKIPRWSSVLLIDNGVANQPPTANAGGDVTLTLPTNTVSVTGSGSDPDGSITAYQWTKVSGPATFNIVSPTSASTVINNLVAGTYIFQLAVTDNGTPGLVGTDQMQIVVQPVQNQAPTANAGADQSFALPQNTTTLNGSGADPDGSIVSYGWVKLAGSPSGGAISNATIAGPSLSGLVQGVYQYQLTVTDNGTPGLTDKDTVQITVNAAANLPPTSIPGANQTITLPTTTTTFVGSGTDPDGSISAYLWAFVSGPSTPSITSPTSATTGITALTNVGDYIFSLKVTDNGTPGLTDTKFIKVTVSAANIAPTANAGIDQVITLPTNTATLSGSGTDPDGIIVSYAWVKISGPTGGSITSPTSAMTGVTALQQGTYVYQLTVTDDDGDTGTDFMQILVNPAIPPPNIPPTADAGTDQVVTLPTSTTTLIGSGNDPDGTIAAYLWTKISGPTGGAITSSTSATTGITGLLAGVYTYQLRVTDNSGDTATDAMQVTVNAANILPTANAGSDQIITLPTSTTTLVGSGTDPDGTIASYLWVKVSGPSGGAITSSTSATTGITGLLQGVYVYRLRVTDNAGDTAVDAIQVTVNAAPANVAPTANAGSDQVLPNTATTTLLIGSGNDPDGSIISYTWLQISGAGSTIATPNSASTNITGLTGGVYRYQLTVTDNGTPGLTGKDTVQVTVNTPPTADAGSNVIITLPTNSTSLSGSGSTDPDGTIVGYLWSNISGPNTATFGTANNVTTTVTGLIEGTYIIRLTVTDNNGATATTQVQITVLPIPNVAPSANAGPNKAITLPVNSVTLVGSGTDTDGTIAGYSWTYVNGPSGSVIVTPNAATTDITFTTAGTYNFRLTVTDDGVPPLTGSDVVQIVVNPVVPPNVAVPLKRYKIIAN